MNYFHPNLSYIVLNRLYSCQALFWHLSLLILESSTRLETKTFCQVCTLKSKATKTDNKQISSWPTPAAATIFLLQKILQKKIVWILQWIENEKIPQIQVGIFYNID